MVFLPRQSQVVISISYKAYFLSKLPFIALNQSINFELLVVEFLHKIKAIYYIIAVIWIFLT